MLPCCLTYITKISMARKYHNSTESLFLNKIIAILEMALSTVQQDKMQKTKLPQIIGATPNNESTGLIRISEKGVQCINL